MPEPFFIQEYRNKAEDESQLVQSGRGRKYEVVDVLHAVREALGLLEVEREHDVLNIGCANGLFDIVLSGCCRTLVSVEPVEELAKIATANLSEYANATVKVGHAGSIPCDAESFDRVLLTEVIQLIPASEFRGACAEIVRVMRGGARVAIGSIPNLNYRDAFLKDYLEGVRKAEHLTEEVKEAIIEGNLKASWYDPDELIALWAELGCKATMIPVKSNHPNADHRFHMIVER